MRANRVFNILAAIALTAGLGWFACKTAAREYAAYSAKSAQAAAVQGEEVAAAAKRAAAVRLPAMAKLELPAEGDMAQGPFQCLDAADQGGGSIWATTDSPPPASAVSAVSGGDSNVVRFTMGGNNFSVGSVVGVKVSIKWSVSNGFDIPSATDITIKLTSGGAEIGSNKAVGGAIPTIAAFTDYGTGVSDDWGATLTTALVNATDFGVDIVVNTATPNDQVTIEEVDITVYETSDLGDIVLPSYFSLTADSGSPGGSDGWNTPDKAENAPDGVYATNNDATEGTTYLNFTQWQGEPVPDDAQILGITIAFFGHVTGGTPGARGYNAGLIYNGSSLAGTSLDKGSSDLLPGSDGWSADLGGQTDLWNATLTPAIVNDPTFGVQLRCTFGGGGFVASVDSGRMTVFWGAGFIGPPTQTNINCADAISARYAVLNFRAPPMESMPTGPVREDVHIANLAPMYVQPRPRPQRHACMEPMERIDPTVFLAGNEIEPLRAEQIMTMGVQRPPAPRRRPEQVILMGEYDPTSFTLPDAPEFIHPENQVPMPCLPIGPQEARPWMDPISSEVGFVSLLSSGSAEPATYHQIDANPRRDWPRQYQPAMSNLDPGAPTVSSTPLAILPPMGLPVRQRPRVQPPAIEARSYVTATPGDQAVYPIGMTMTANPPAARRQVQPPAQSLILDAWSGQQFVEPSMFVGRPVPQRSSIPAIEASSLAPQQFGETAIIGWNTPLSVPVRPRRPAQNITLTGELDGETVDLTNLTPTGWQADEPAQINPRLRPAQPPAESVVLELPPSVDPGLLEPMSVATRPGVRRPRPAESLIVFTDIGHENSEFMRSMGQPVRQRPRPIVSPAGQGVEFESFFVAPQFELTSMDTPLGAPAGQLRRMNQAPLEVEPLDRSSQSAPLVAGMDAPKPAAVRRPQAQPNLPPITDPLAAAPDFMAMSSPPRRAASPQIVVGGSPIPTPEVFQTTTEPIEPMYAGVRRAPPRQQAPSAAIIVDQQYFTGIVDPSSYTGMAQLPRRVASRLAIQAAIESSTTTGFYPTGNTPAFVGSGEVIVAAGWVGSAVGVVAGKATRASKGI